MSKDYTERVKNRINHTLKDVSPGDIEDLKDRLIREEQWSLVFEIERLCGCSEHFKVHSNRPVDELNVRAVRFAEAKPCRDHRDPDEDTQEFRMILEDVGGEDAVRYIDHNTDLLEPNDGEDPDRE